MEYESLQRRIWPRVDSSRPPVISFDGLKFQSARDASGDTNLFRSSRAMVRVLSRSEDRYADRNRAEERLRFRSPRSVLIIIRQLGPRHACYRIPEPRETYLH